MSIDSQLDTLEASGLIRLSTVRPELLYLFRHWLVQDAAYSSLLKQERRELHRLVGEALEKLYPEHREEQAAELALHFERAELPARAVPYLIAAGQFALDRYAQPEARSFFDRAAALIPQDAGPEWRQHQAMIAVGRIKSGFAVRSFDEQIATAEEAVPLAESIGDQAMLLELYLFIVVLRQQRGERYETSVELKHALDQVSKIGAAIGEPSAPALPLAMLGMEQVRAGELLVGTANLEKAIPLLAGKNASIGASLAADTLSLGYTRMGDFTRAREAAELAIRLAQDGDPIARLDAQIMKANLESMAGNLDQAETIAQECVARADELGSPACAVFSRFILGDLQLRRGQPEKALPTLEQGDLMAFGAAFVKPLLVGWLAAVRAELGDLEGARSAWLDAIAGASGVGDRFTEAAIRLRRAATLARQPDPEWEEIARDLEFSVAVFSEAQARPYLADSLEVYGQALAAVGRAAESRSQLERARQVRASMTAVPAASLEPV